MSGALILLVEDDATLGASLRQRLELEGFGVSWARSATEARTLLASLQPAIILSDIRLPDGDGETVMRSHFDRNGLVPTIFMTAFGDIDQAVRLVRAGALNYVTKPFDLDQLIEELQNITRRSLVKEAPADPFANSPAMREIGQMLKRAAATDMPVLLLGETGTGKEVAARYLHASGPRASAQFVPVNCGALPADLADSMIFGHERGSFTGAVGAHRGFVEETEGGTLFLDEIGDLPLPLQVKLLRVLESREYRRLGGSDTRNFNGRIVCATNQDLAALVAEGKFREDLWFRINVITLQLPPLRERGSDIGGLLKAFVASAAQKAGRLPPEIGAEAIDAALAHRWPGNIREMINRVDRAVALGNDTVLTARDLFPDGSIARSEPRAQPVDDTLSAAREAAERAQIVSALAKTDGSLKDAAELLGVSRTTLWDKMRRYGVGDQ
ncbi:sigma-54-dependent transcriptional regulator [Georhizobium sp. MAB10]|uniref:sigma-54-dependent transcriptional regulator n=1 Tax=Georhizobium sp. MAB10 TaxID=3028319 RepID=UPI003855BED6